MPAVEDLKPAIVQQTTQTGATASNHGQVILIGEFRFPNGDAAAIRTMSLARIFRDLGFKVTVLGKGQVRADDYRPELHGYFIEGIRYSTMNPKPVSMLHKLLNPISRMKLFVSTLEALDLKDCRAIVINASDSARHVPFVRHFCRRRSIPLIGDVCEWYSPRQLNGGWVNPFYAVFCLVFYFFIPRLKNLIVVSKLLERRFEGKGRTVIRIAAPIDLSDIPHDDLTPNNRLVLLYAGIPGRKDLLKEILVALATLAPEERSRIEFRLLGPTRRELIQILGGSAHLLETLAGTVTPLGRVPRSEVLAALQEAHFSVLLRPNMRYANAGFPSKVVESLAAGTPVLLNFTGDLKDYLADETAALVIDGHSPKEVTVAIRRALKLTTAELRNMRLGARLKAQQYFDYRLYLRSLAQFLEHLH
jgi:glycosyltransferase involved in cell wall biosynthesis